MSWTVKSGAGTPAARRAGRAVGIAFERLAWVALFVGDEPGEGAAIAAGDRSARVGRSARVDRSKTGTSGAGGLLVNLGTK